MAHWPSATRTDSTTFGTLSRSELMSRVRSTGNATTELHLIRLLRASRLLGWRRHRRLPGRPDFTWERQRLVVFVDGCFWHGHACGRNLTPKSNVAEWQTKLARTRRRDRKVTRQLRDAGWTVLRIWECDLRRRPDVAVRRIARAVGPKERR
jgi:DNA mismatch endonuclease (patch repair protein)